MEFLENAVSVTKEILDVACKKTGEAMTVQKQKFNVVSLKNSRSKDFKKLGEIYYKNLKNTEIEDEMTALLVEAITEKTARIKELNDEISMAKNKLCCPECSSLIDENSLFCSICGTKIERGESK